MLVHTYELFKIDANETITQMFTRFKGIINELNVLGRTYANFNLVRNLLRSIPRIGKRKSLPFKKQKIYPNYLWKS